MRITHDCQTETSLWNLTNGSIAQTIGLKTVPIIDAGGDDSFLDGWKLAYSTGENIRQKFS